MLGGGAIITIKHNMSAVFEMRVCVCVFVRATFMGKIDMCVDYLALSLMTVENKHYYESFQLFVKSI